MQNQLQCLQEIVSTKLKGVTLKGCKVWQKRFEFTILLIFDSSILHIHTRISNSSKVIYSMLPSIRTVPVSAHLKQKPNFWRALFQFSGNEVFRMKAEHFSFKMKVFASLKLAKQSQKTRFCSGQVQVSKLFMANICDVYCAVKLVLLSKRVGNVWYFQRNCFIFKVKTLKEVRFSELLLILLKIRFVWNKGGQKHSLSIYWCQLYRIDELAVYIIRIRFISYLFLVFTWRHQNSN